MLPASSPGCFAEELKIHRLLQNRTKHLLDIFSSSFSLFLYFLVSFCSLYDSYEYTGLESYTSRRNV